jgi:putative tryptophan/tyrosine transport system substrate-binding protein
MRRRAFITLLGGATAWPLPVRAQQTGKVYHIGFLANDPTIPAQPAGRAFLDGLRESGFIEGKNVVIERRFAEGRVDRYAPLVAELMRLEVNVIVTSANNATRAAKQANTTIPIVMVNVFDPVGQGLVASLANPGGNITGVIMDDSPEISAKRLQLLRDAIPHVSRAAVLVNPEEAYAAAELKALELAAQSLKIVLLPIAVHQVGDFEGAFARMADERCDALLIPNAELTFTHRRLITQLAAKSLLPVMSSFREITEAGGLMSYSTVRVDRFRRAAVYVGKILKGAKPADLPVEEPTKYELVINLRSAKSLNVEITRDLLLVADDVIE